MKNFLFVLLFPLVTMAQEAAIIEPVVLVDYPTAGTLLRGSFNAHLRAYAEGGILGGVDVGLTDRFMIGLAYGGTNVIGIGSVNGNPQVGAHVRYRLFEEDFTLPANRSQALRLPLHDDRRRSWIHNSNNLADFIESIGINHIRGTPNNSQTQGKIDYCQRYI